MKYKDTDGQVLYGYSQTNLDNNTKAVERQTEELRKWRKLVTIAMVIGLVLLVAIWVYLDYKDLPSNFINALAMC